MVGINHGRAAWTRRALFSLREWGAPRIQGPSCQPRAGLTGRPVCSGLTASGLAGSSPVHRPLPALPGLPEERRTLPCPTVPCPALLCPACHARRELHEEAKARGTCPACENGVRSAALATSSGHSGTLPVSPLCGFNKQHTVVSDSDCHLVLYSNETPVSRGEHTPSSLQRTPPPAAPGAPGRGG